MLYNNIYQELAGMVQATSVLSATINPSVSRQQEFPPLVDYQDVQITFRSMHSPQPGSGDSCISENSFFRYPVFLPGNRNRVMKKTVIGEKGKIQCGNGQSVSDSDKGKYQSVILLMHGLNERRWDKYLPWAYALCRKNRCPVMVLPLAFHLNRAPIAWGDIRQMTPLARQRKQLEHHNRFSSFANAALSQRIDEDPSRFIRGANQTAHDIEQTAIAIRSGKDPLIARDARINFFSYSIGCSLTQALLMYDASRPEGGHLFAGSRAFLFCGGSIMEYANPVSKAILDESAFTRLNHYFDGYSTASIDGNTAGIPMHNLRETIFASLMRFRAAENYRTAQLEKLGSRVKAVLLSTDSVFPEKGLRDSFRSGDGNSLFEIDILEGPEGSCHEQPFPLGPDRNFQESVHIQFEALFDCASAHLG